MMVGGDDMNLGLRMSSLYIYMCVCVVYSIIIIYCKLYFILVYYYYCVLYIHSSFLQVY